MSVFKASIIYFGLVFAAGFSLGVVRTIWIAPLIGERTAEIVETPVMIVLSFLAARFVVGRMKAPSLAHRLEVGGLALLLLVLCEVGVVVLIRQQSLAEYVANRDPVAGVVYLVALAVFAAAPALVGRKSD